MKLSEEVKNNIINEYSEWFNSLYSNTSREERRALGAVFTPPEITIRMIEKLDNLNGDILDPCCGAGNLLAGCIIAGANPKRVFGNEYEQRFVDVARQRLNKFGVETFQIHQGDATDKRCIQRDSFSKSYKYPFGGLFDYNPEEYKQITLFDN